MAVAKKGETEKTTTAALLLGNLGVATNTGQYFEGG